MFAKIVTLIVCFGLIACMMLSLRQQRIQAGHELARAQAKLAELDRDVLRLKLQIASRLTPDQIETKARKLGQLMPLTMERYQELVRREAEEAASGTVVTVADPVR